MKTMTWLLACAAVFVGLGCGGSNGGGGGGGGGSSGGGSGGATGGGGGTTGGGSGTLPPPEVAITGTRETFDAFSYIVPVGMTEMLYADGVVMTNSANTGCSLSLLGKRASTGNLPQQALDTLIAFGGTTYTGFHDENGGLQPLNYQRRGVTAGGQAFVQLEGAVTNASGAELANGRIMLVDLGGQVAPIIALGNCYTSLGDQGLDWTRLFHSLQFPGAAATGSATLAAQLVGKWFINSGSVFLGETWAANGHYASASAFQSYSTVSSTEIEQTTTTFFGDGTWAAQGDVVATFPASGQPSSHLVRILSEMNSAVASGWLDRVYELKLSAVDGNAYEYNLVRDSQ